MATEDEQDYTSFGQYLKNARQEKNISIETVAEAIKIQSVLVLQLEDEAHDRLPTEVFVKGFIRTYADTVGVDGDTVVQKYMESVTVYKKTLKAESNKREVREKIRHRLLISAGAVIAMVFLFFVGMQSDGNNLQNDLEMAPSEDKKGAAQWSDQQGTAKKREQAASNEHENKNDTDNILLRILTIEATSLKIVVDNQDPQNYNLHPGDRLEFEASSDFNILVGSAHAVRLSLNDKPFRISGKEGQMVNVKIP